METRTTAYTCLPYHKERLKVTASAFPKNLDVLETGERRSFVVSHRSRVCILIRDGPRNTYQRLLDPFPSDSDNDGEVDSKTFITQVKFCHLHSGQTVLVIASFSGFVVLDSMDLNILLHYRLSPGPSSTGTSEGSVLVFSVAGRQVDYNQQLQGGNSSICDLEILSDCRLASAHEDGSIMLLTNPLKTGGEESSVEIQQPNKTVCVCLSSLKDVLIGGFSDGRVTFYSTTRGQRLADISAHGRSITALDVVKNQGLVLSVSEDGTASVWKVVGTKTPKISLVYTAAVDNGLLCGGRFWGQQGLGFALTAYDSDKIIEYSRA